MKRKPPLKRATVTIHPDDCQTIERLAQKRDASFSWLVRRGMREYLKRNRVPGPARESA